MGQDNVA